MAKYNKKPIQNNQTDLLEKRETWQDETNIMLLDAKRLLEIDNLTWSHLLTLKPSANHKNESALKELLEICKKHQEQKLILWPEEAEAAVIAELNAKHAVVHTERTYILTEKGDTSGFILESKQSLRDYYEDEVIRCADGKLRSKADIWLKSNQRRKYSNIIFNPSVIGPINGCYNIWKGFAKQPQQGICILYWEHVLKNICNSNEEYYRYVRKWLAIIFQHPDKVHTALVLCGSQGVGKNSFVEPLGILLGQHYVLLSNIHELTSNFNFHLKNAVLIHANEAFWGGNKKEVGTLKAMITEEKCLIEGKGKDRIMVKNYRHVIMSSNEDWPVALDPDDRRFLVLRVAEHRKEDHAYFRNMQDQLNNGGFEALLYDLLHEDLINFNPRILPKSIDAFNLKIRSVDSAHRYLYEALDSGGFSKHIDDGAISVWQGTIPRADVYDDYLLWCKASGEEPVHRELFGRIIKKLIPSIKDIRPTENNRIRCYQLPDLAQARTEFCRAFKEEPDNIF